MNDYNIAHSLGELTPNVCSLMDLELPDQQSFKANADVLDVAEKIIGKDTKIEKAFFYASDAVGDFLLKRYPEFFRTLIDDTDIMVTGTSVMPSITPVCFGTIFSGVTPEIHGIRQYEKPTLKCETLFDVLARAGKKVAILSDNNCSIDRIFRDRPIDYYTASRLDFTYELAKDVLKNYDYDVILLYDGRYDMYMHHHGVHSEIALDSLKNGIERFHEFAALTDEVWKGFNRMMTYCPDHGAHEISSERGSHGEDIADDMIVNHFYRFRQAKS